MVQAEGQEEWVQPQISCLAVMPLSVQGRFPSSQWGRPTLSGQFLQKLRHFL